MKTSSPEAVVVSIAIDFLEFTLAASESLTFIPPGIYLFGGICKNPQHVPSSGRRGQRRRRRDRAHRARRLRGRRAPTRGDHRDRRRQRQLDPRPPHLESVELPHHQCTRRRLDPNPGCGQLAYLQQPPHTGSVGRRPPVGSAGSERVAPRLQHAELPRRRGDHGAHRQRWQCPRAGRPPGDLLRRQSRCRGLTHRQRGHHARPRTGGIRRRDVGSGRARRRSHLRHRQPHTHREPGDHRQPGAAAGHMGHSLWSVQWRLCRAGQLQRIPRHRRQPYFVLGGLYRGS